MSDIVITVRGEHEERIAPEEGVIRLAVRAEGHERATTVARATEAASALRSALSAREEAAEIREWSSGRLTVWSDRPWNTEGRRLPLVHHASVEVTAAFSDLDALSAWAGEVASRDAIQVNGIDWRLSPATAREAEARVAARAVLVAVERATAYANALGRSEVVPVEVADAGLLGRPDAPPAPRMMRAAMVADTGAGLDLRPADIVVSATVEARFTAR